MATRDLLAFSGLVWGARSRGRVDRQRPASGTSTQSISGTEGCGKEVWGKVWAAGNSDEDADGTRLAQRLRGL